MSTTERIKSDEIHRKVLGLFEGIQRDRSKATEQKNYACQRIRKVIEDDGYQLCSDSNDIAFSKHGSLHEQTSVNKVNDIDIYVCFNGKGLNWYNSQHQSQYGNLLYDVHNQPRYGNFISLPSSPIFNYTGLVSSDPTSPRAQLYGSSRIQVNKNLVKLEFTDGLDANKAKDLLYRLLFTVYRYNNLERTRRGISMTINRRSYDIIPAFLYYDSNGYMRHIIPNGNNWEDNPTQQTLSQMNDLNDKFPRRSLKLDIYYKIIEYNTLSFKDIYRLFKAISKQAKWKDIYGISSFILKMCCINYFNSIRANPQSLNQTLINGVIDILQSIVVSGTFWDPISQVWINFIGYYWLFNAKTVVNLFLGIQI